LKEALLKQLELTKERDALKQENDALTKENDALTRAKEALTKEKEVQLAAFTKEKDALAQQLAAAILTCAALKNSTDHSVDIQATGVYPPSQAAAAGAYARATRS
jgi:septal ring factor EnvC (AmiA/AmiB activator)